jgi:hypothetical protein
MPNLGTRLIRGSLKRVGATLGLKRKERLGGALSAGGRAGEECKEGCQSRSVAQRCRRTALGGQGREWLGKARYVPWSLGRGRAGRGLGGTRASD